MSKAMSKRRETWWAGLMVGLGLLALLWALGDMGQSGRDYALDHLDPKGHGLTVYLYKPGEGGTPRNWRRLAGSKTSYPLGPDPGALDYRAFLLGWLRLAKSQTVTVAAGSDDGVTVRVNGVRVFNDWSEHPIRTKRNQVELDSGDHLLEVYFFQSKGDAFLNLAVEGPDGRALRLYPMRASFEPARWQGLRAWGRARLPWFLLLCALLFSSGAALLLKRPLAALYAARFNRLPNSGRP